jgi:hypothetical protein
MLHEEHSNEAGSGSDIGDGADGTTASAPTDEDRQVTAADDADDYDDDLDDDDDVSEERQRHAALRMQALAEIRRAWQADDWEAALWWLQRSGDEPVGPYCPVCAPTYAPDVVHLRTPEARAAAKFLDDDERSSWGPHCRNCGEIVRR